MLGASRDNTEGGVLMCFDSFSINMLSLPGVIQHAQWPRSEWTGKWKDISECTGSGVCDVCVCVLLRRVSFTFIMPHLHVISNLDFPQLDKQQDWKSINPVIG